MATHVDPWLNNIQITKTVFNNNPLSCKSSQVTGRKINNGFYTLKSKKAKKIYPSIIDVPTLIKKRTDSTKSIILKKSPGRSLSLNRIVSEKDFDKKIKLEYPHYISPPRHPKLKKDKRKQLSQIIESQYKTTKKAPIVKSLLTESLSRILQEKQEIMKKETQDKLKSETKKEKLKHTNEQIRRKNAGYKKSCDIKHPKPWGVDQRSYKESADGKFSDTCEMKVKNKNEKEGHRSEREGVKRERGKNLGSELVSVVRAKVKKCNKSEDKPKTKRSPDPNIISYMKQKKKSKKVTELQNKLEETIRERERVQALIKLEKMHKKPLIKKKKKKHSKSHWRLGVDKSAENGIFSSERKEKYLTSATEDTNRENSEEHHQAITEKLRKLKERVTYTQSILKTQAALTIQKWFRANKQKFKSKQFVCFEDSLESSSKNEANSGGWIGIDVLPQPQVGKSDLVQRFEKKLHEKHTEIERRAQLFDSNEGHVLVKNEDMPGVINGSYPEPLIQESDQSKPKVVHKIPPLSLGTIASKSSSDIESSSKYIQSSLLSEPTNPYKYRENGKVSIDSNIDIESHIKSLNSYISQCSSSISITEEVSKSIKSYRSDKSNKSQKSCKSDASNKSQTSERFRNFNTKFPGIVAKINSHPEELKTPSKVRHVAIVESPKDSLEEPIKHELSSSENSSESQNPENLLKNILSRNPPSNPSQIIERPGLILIDDPSSDEEWNSHDLLFYPGSSPASQPTEEKSKIIDNSHSDYMINFEIKIIQLIQDEIKLYLEVIPFSTSEKPVNPKKEFVEDYMRKLEGVIVKNENEILELINTPYYYEPLTKLEKLQITEVGKLEKYPTLELILPPNLGPVLKKQFNAGDIPSKHIYLQMLFDCINESLNHIRPFGLKGLPDPWTMISPILYGEGQLKIVIEKVNKLIFRWEGVHAGAYPDESCNSDDEKLQKLREDRLGIMLSQNVQDDEARWLDYDEEETQSKIEVSDMIFDFVVNETAGLLSDKILVFDESEINFNDYF